MKRAFLISVLLLLLLIIYQSIVTYFSNEHQINYSLNVNQKDFEINETFKKDYYLIKVKFEDKTIIFDLDNSFKKQKKIIHKIIFYEEDQYLCLQPSFVIKEVEPKIYCHDGQRQVSFQALKNTIDSNLVKKALNFKEESYVDKLTNPIDINSLLYYVSNAKKGEHIAVYRYKDLDILNEEKRNNFKFSDTDIYQNKQGTFLDNYFLFPIINEDNTIKGYNIVDLTTSFRSFFFFGESISKNSYIQGIVDHKVYLIDKTFKRQYEIIPKESKYNLIASSKEEASYYDGRSWSKVDIQNFVNQESYFKDKTYDELKAYKYLKAFEDERAYYYYDNNNNFYKVYKEELGSSIYLFRLNNFNDVFVSKSNLYYLDDIYLYRYDDFGIKTLVKYNEFKYNFTNLVFAYNE